MAKIRIFVYSDEKESILKGTFEEIGGAILWLERLKALLGQSQRRNKNAKKSP